MKIHKTVAAREDIKNIWLHCALQSGEERADDLLRRINMTLQATICRFPNSGRARPELGLAIRSFPVLPYVAFYTTRHRHIHLLRLLHGRRDLKKPLISLLLAG